MLRNSLILCTNSFLDPLHPQNRITSSYRNRVCKISTAETKILIILCYYALFAVVSLPYLTVGLGNLDEFVGAIGRYFVCESAGSQMECNRSELDQFNYPGSTITTSVLFGFIPCVNLIFVINWEVTKDFWQSIWMRWFTCVTREHATLPSNDQTMEAKLD